jgi:hypothetical protein
MHIRGSVVPTFRTPRKVGQPISSIIPDTKPRDKGGAPGTFLTKFDCAKDFDGVVLGAEAVWCYQLCDRDFGFRPHTSLL